MGLSNAQYDAIMRRYSERQSENKRIQSDRRTEISARIPEFDELDKRIAELSMDYAITALEGDGLSGDSLKKLQHNIQTLSARKSELLEANGYAANYLEPVFTCYDCQDTGYIDNQKCHCFKKAITELFYSQSNIKNIRANETFDTFSIHCYSHSFKDPATNKSAYDHMVDVYKLAYNFADNFGKEDSTKNLLFYGDTGLGKTFLSNCIANKLINSCHSVIYLTAIELFDTYSQSTFNKDSDQNEVVQEITDCDLLIIDDLGTELSNSFTNSRLFYCINDRLLKDKSTIISTNLTLNKLYEQYSDRIFSRIMHSYKAVKFYGDNIRLAAFKPSKLS